MLHRLTTLPSRQAPAHILRELRVIDHRAELVELMPGRWILGIVTKNDERIRRGTALLAQELRKDSAHQSLARVRFARLCMEGFGQVCAYEMNEPDRRIVADFMERDYNFRHYLREKQREHEAEVEGDNKRDRTAKYARDRASQLGRSIHRIIFRKKRSFSGKGSDYGSLGRHLSEGEL